MTFVNNLTGYCRQQADEYGIRGSQIEPNIRSFLDCGK